MTAMESTAQPVPDMNVLLHQSRGAMLRGLPRDVGVFLSAGCSGKWFFDWIEQCCGPVRRHIGVENQVPRPEGLADNVEWVENDCWDMSGIGDGLCDILFSGQRLGYLWPGELAGFFLEAARVIKPGGLLVVDGLNRLVTATSGWSHPEHTVETTVQEVAELAGLAGFSVKASKGLWLDRDPATRRVLPHVPVEAGGLSVTERLLGAVAHPDDAFMWWLEARRTGSPPDADAVRRRAHDVFRAAWPERVRRTVAGPGACRHAAGGGDWLSYAPTATMAPVRYGPYMPLPAGRYSCEFHLDKPKAGDKPGAGGTSTVVCDVCVGRFAEPLVSRRVILEGGRMAVKLEFELDRLESGVQFRCFGEAGSPFLCHRTVDFRDLRQGAGIEVDLSSPVTAMPDSFGAEGYSGLEEPPPPSSREDGPPEDPVGLGTFTPDPALLQMQAADSGNPVTIIQERMTDNLLNRRA